MCYICIKQNGVLTKHGCITSAAGGFNRFGFSI
uniref:Uncharacterized protein n=1 Tax=Anguilla anguilla TaxID=7936 RepID=A0A0E9VIX8_ANGAN